MHVRDYTKGHPTIEANNHPIRHGAVVGIHNGIIVNDEEIFAALRLRARAARDDGRLRGDLRARRARAGQPGGARGAVRRDGHRLARRARRRSTLFLARGVGRPLWVGTGSEGLFFASTSDALEVLESTLRLTLRKREVEEGMLLRVEDGRVTAVHRFRPDRSYVEETALPAVRAPHEGASCLKRLAAIALAA